MLIYVRYVLCYQLKLRDRIDYAYNVCIGVNLLDV